MYKQSAHIKTGIQCLNLLGYTRRQVFMLLEERMVRANWSDVIFQGNMAQGKPSTIWADVSLAIGVDKTLPMARVAISR